MQGISFHVIPRKPSVVARISIDGTMNKSQVTQPISNDVITVTSSEEETIRIESCEEVFPRE